MNTSPVKMHFNLFLQGINDILFRNRFKEQYKNIKSIFFLKWRRSNFQEIINKKYIFCKHNKMTIFEMLLSNELIFCQFDLNAIIFFYFFIIFNLSLFSDINPSMKINLIIILRMGCQPSNIAQLPYVPLIIKSKPKIAPQTSISDLSSSINFKVLRKSSPTLASKLSMINQKKKQIRASIIAASYQSKTSIPTDFSKKQQQQKIITNSSIIKQKKIQPINQQKKKETQSQNLSNISPNKSKIQKKQSKLQDTNNFYFNQSSISINLGKTSLTINEQSQQFLKQTRSKIVNKTSIIEFNQDDIFQIDQTDVKLSSLFADITYIIQKQPAVGCIIKADYIKEILALFQKGYVDRQTSQNILQLVMAIIQDSILFVNEGRMTKSQFITKEIIDSNQYIQKLTEKIHKIEQQTYFVNLYTLKMLDYACETGKNKIDKKCYQHLTYDFSIEEVYKVAQDVKQLCKFDMRAFAYLSNYLLKCCQTMKQKDKNNTVQQINQKLNKTIELLKLKHPAAKNVEFETQFINKHIKYISDKQYTPKQVINLKNIKFDERADSFDKFIQERVNEAHKNYPIFVQLVKNICLQEEGYHFKTGLKLSNMKNKKAVNRIKEKMLSAEFKKLKLTSKVYKNLNEFFSEESLHCEKQMKSMFDETVVQFSVSDMIRGKCVFPSIKNINSCASLILAKILQKAKEGKNIHNVQVDNRLSKHTCDLVLKIQINETICELQLTSDKVQTVANQFNHKLFQLNRSKFFTPLSMLKVFNDEISNDFFGEILQIIEANIKSSDGIKYGQKITFEIANSFMPQFIKMLPTKINQFDNSVDVKLIIKYIKKLKNFNSKKIKVQNIQERIRDTARRNGNFKYKLSKFEIAEEELTKLCQSLKQNWPSLFTKINKMTWSQITIQQKNVAKEYYQAAHLIGAINLNKELYTKAMPWYLENNVILSQNVLDDKVNYAVNLSQLGLVYEKYGDDKKAIQYYQRCLHIQENIRGQNCIESAATLNNIGAVYNRQSKYKQALSYYQRCLKIQEEVEGKGFINSADTLNNIGGIYDSLKNYQKAIQCYQRSLQIKITKKGKGCIDSASTLNNLGGSYKNLQNYDKALQYYFYCLQIEIKVKGEECIDSASTFNNIGQVYSRLKNYSQAIKYFQKCLKIEENVKEKGFVDSASTLNNLASSFQSNSQFEKAVQYYQRAINIMKDDKHQEYALSNYNLGFCFLNKMQKYEQAIPCFLEAEQLYLQFSHQQQTYKKILKTLSVCYQKIGNEVKEQEYKQKLQKCQKLP